MPFEAAQLRKTGPCLFCGHNITYGEMTYGRLSKTHYERGDKWLDKVFEPKRRSKEIAYLQGRTDKRDGLLEWKTLGPYVCRSCYDETIKQKKRAAAHLHELCEDYRRRKERHYTWRVPKPGDLDTSARHQRFIAVLPNHRVYEITFTYRASYECQIRGDDPGYDVVMRVDGKLTARYRDWNLGRPVFKIPTDEAGHPGIYGDKDERLDKEHDDETGDIFGQGFTRWFEREFQAELVAAAPDRVEWRNKTYTAGDPYDNDPLYLVHTIADAGPVRVRARLYQFHTFWGASRFAKEVLELDIQETEPLKLAARVVQIG